jgi:hypothetical protein
MLPTRFAEFNPIVEVLAIKLNAPVAPHRGDRFLGDQVSERGWCAPDILGGGGHVQQTAFVAFLHRRKPLKHSLGDGVGEYVKALIARGCQR